MFFFLITYHSFKCGPWHYYSLNCFQRTSQRSHFISVCWSPINKSSYCAFKCLFTCSTIIPAILHKSPYVIKFMDYYCGEYFSFSANLRVSWIWSMHFLKEILLTISSLICKIPPQLVLATLESRLWFCFLPSPISWNSRRQKNFRDGKPFA